MRPWLSVEPCDHAVDIDRGGNGDMLQVRFHHTPIPGPAQAKGAAPLGERPFDPSALLLGLAPLLTGIPGPGRGERLVLVLGWQPQPAALLLGLGT